MAVAERLRGGEHGVPGGHPGEERLKGWQESDQGPLLGHRLLFSAAADKGHARLKAFPVREAPLRAAAGTPSLLASPGRVSSSQAWEDLRFPLLGGSPVPKHGLFLPTAVVCLPV